MANIKRSAKERRIIEEKERIANIAKWLLVAFCLQFIFYLGIINIVPIYEGTSENINSLYTEKWNDYKDFNSGKHITKVHTEGNGIKFIYAYNMVLLVASTGLVLYYAMVFMEEYEGIVSFKAKEFFKEHKGLMFLVLFIGWVFLSSCFAGDKFRSFIGCYNLRDGFFSFMFYGSVLVCILLMGISGFEGKVKLWFKKFEVDPRRVIVDVFLVVMTLIAVVTIGDYKLLYSNVENPGIEIRYEDGSSVGNGIGISIEPKYIDSAKTQSEETVELVRGRVSKTTVTSSVFNNSNHYAYVLSIAVVVAAVMFIKDKNIIAKILYMLSFVILTYMVIINDTFGAYLGIMVALALILIHTLLTRKNIIFVLLATIVFATCSATIKNPNGQNIVEKNFAYIGNSITAILGIDTNKNENTDNGVDNSNVVLSGEVLSGEIISGEVISGEVAAVDENKKENVQIDAGDAGSGRWKLWVGALKIIKKYPIFGVGLENMIYKYADIGINEGRSHNLILQLAGTVGIPGMIFYVLGVTFIFFKALKYYKIWDTYTYMGMFVMVSYLLSSLTGNSGFYTSGYFYIFVGFVVLGTISCKKQVELEDKKQKENLKMLQKNSLKNNKKN